MSQQLLPRRAYRTLLWRTVSYLTAATVAAISVASAPRPARPEGPSPTSAGVRAPVRPEPATV